MKSDHLYYKNYLQYPQLEGVQLMWHDGYYDGPLDGLCIYQDRICWFNVCEQGETYTIQDLVETFSETGVIMKDDGFYRRYVVHSLTDEQIVDERYWHDLFQKHVGTTRDYEYDLSGVRHRNTSRTPSQPQSEWPKFYEPFAARVPPDYESTPPIGWFED